MTVHTASAGVGGTEDMATAATAMALHAAILLLLGGALAWCLRHDARHLRCGALATAMLACLLNALVLTASWAGVPTGPPVGVLAPQPGTTWLLAWPLPLTLVGVGAVMGMPGRRRPANIIGLLAGLGLVTALVVSTATWVDRDGRVRAVPMLIICLAAWGSLVLLTWVGQGVLLALRGRRRALPAPRVVVILGAKLVRGRVGRLLVAGIEAGIAQWRAAQSHRPGTPVLLVLSGGVVGGPVPEAEAMARYALAHGVPQECLILEDCSRSTTENLLRTRELLVKRGLEGAGVVLVTSDFHVARTAARVSRLGLPWSVAGAHGRWFQRLGNSPRELSATAMEHRGAAGLALLGVMAYGAAVAGGIL